MTLWLTPCGIAERDRWPCLKRNTTGSFERMKKSRLATSISVIPGLIISKTKANPDPRWHTLFQ